MPAFVFAEVAFNEVSIRVLSIVVRNICRTCGIYYIVLTNKVIKQSKFEMELLIEIQAYKKKVGRESNENQVRIT